jgi:hypothetical protein
MDTRYFQRLFRYDNWANGEVLMALRVAKEPSAQVLRWLGHLAGAGHTWLARVNGKACPLAIWPELTMEECDHFLMLLGDEWQRYLDALAPAELSSMVEYRNSRGEEFSTTIVDILTQVLTLAATIEARLPPRCGLAGIHLHRRISFLLQGKACWRDSDIRIALFRTEESNYRKA